MAHVAWLNDNTVRDAIVFGWQLAPTAIANCKHFVGLGGCGIGFALEFEFDFVFEIIGRELA